MFPPKSLYLWFRASLIPGSVFPAVKSNTAESMSLRLPNKDPIVFLKSYNKVDTLKSLQFWSWFIMSSKIDIILVKKFCMIVKIPIIKARPLSISVNTAVRGSRIFFWIVLSIFSNPNTIPAVKNIVGKTAVTAYTAKITELITVTIVFNRLTIFLICCKKLIITWITLDIPRNKFNNVVKKGINLVGSTNFCNLLKSNLIFNIPNKSAGLVILATACKVPLIVLTKLITVLILLGVKFLESVNGVNLSAADLNRLLILGPWGITLGSIAGIEFKLLTKSCICLAWTNGVVNGYVFWNVLIKLSSVRANVFTSLIVLLLLIAADPAWLAIYSKIWHKSISLISSILEYTLLIVLLRLASASVMPLKIVCDNLANAIL